MHGHRRVAICFFSLLLATLVSSPAGALAGDGAFAEPALSIGMLPTYWSATPDPGAGGLRLNSWTVFRGGFEALTSMQFAALVGDDAMMARLKGEQTGAGVLAATWVGVALASVVAGGVLWADTLSYPGQGGSAWQIDRLQATQALLVAGLALGSTAWIPMVVVQTRHSWISNYYSPDQARTWVNKYNGGRVAAVSPTRPAIGFRVSLASVQIEARF